MRNNLFTIGQISKIKGITIKALRFYEKVGVIKPVYTDPETKYRYYSLEQFVQLDLIRALRSMDISPKEIRGILEKKDTKQLLEYLDTQQKNALDRIDMLKKTTKMIGLAQNTIYSSISIISNTGINARELTGRYILKKELKTPINEKEVLVQFSEFPVIIEKNNLLDTYETGYGALPDDNNEFHLAYIYNAVALDKKSNKSQLSTIPAGKYICLCFNQENVQKHWAMLAEYLRKNNLKPRLILQVDLLNDVFASANQFLEWQVLV